MRLLRLPHMHAGGSDRLPLRCFRLQDQRFTVRGRLRRPVHWPSEAQAHSSGTLPLTSDQQGQPCGWKEVFVRGLARQGPTEWCISGACSTVCNATVVLVPRGPIYPGTPQTQFSWQGALAACSRRGEQPAKAEPFISWLKPRGFLAHDCKVLAGGVVVRLRACFGT
jgi:hypothetical protein